MSNPENNKEKPSVFIFSNGQKLEIFHDEFIEELKSHFAALDHNSSCYQEILKYKRIELQGQMLKDLIAKEIQKVIEKRIGAKLLGKDLELCSRTIHKYASEIIKFLK